MPKHISSGLKYLAAVKLRQNGLKQQKIAEKLNMNRSTVSHYLNGRNLSMHSIEVAEVITKLSPKDFCLVAHSLFDDDDLSRKIVLIFKNDFGAEVEDSCVGCGLCVDLCFMKAVSLNSLKADIDSAICCGCLLCQEGCPTNSIKIGGK